MLSSRKKEQRDKITGNHNWSLNQSFKLFSRELFIDSTKGDGVDTQGGLQNLNVNVSHNTEEIDFLNFVNA